MLVVYCLKNVDVLEGNRGLPELIAILVTGALHVWKRQMLLSIAGGTVCYMLLVGFVFWEGEAVEFRLSGIIEPPPCLSLWESQGAVLLRGVLTREAIRVLRGIDRKTSAFETEAEVF